MLKTAHKDLILTQDMFMTDQEKDFGDTCDPDKVLSIVDAALSKLQAEKQWDRNKINIEAVQCSFRPR